MTLHSLGRAYVPCKKKTFIGIWISLFRYWGIPSSLGFCKICLYKFWAFWAGCIPHDFILHNRAKRYKAINRTFTMKCSQCNVTHTCEVWMMTTSFIIENPAVILPRNPAVLNWILLRKRFSNSAMFPVVTKSWTSPLVCSFYNTALWSIIGLKVTFHPTFLRFSYTKTLSLLLHSPTIAPAYHFSILINGPETSKIKLGHW